MPLLALDGIRKRYGTHLVLDDVSLAVEAGEVVAVIGRSGSGKTTLLRCINGLETIDEGSITFSGKPLPKDAASLRELRREIGIVFQSYNLFPHHSVERNITLGPTITNKLPLAEAKQIARDVLKMEGIESWVRDQNTAAVFGMRGRFLVPAKLMVRVRDLGLAKTALR